MTETEALELILSRLCVLDAIEANYRSIEARLRAIEQTQVTVLERLYNICGRTSLRTGG